MDRPPEPPEPPALSPAAERFAEFVAQVEDGEAVDFAAFCAATPDLAPELQRLHARWLALFGGQGFAQLPVTADNLASAEIRTGSDDANARARLLRDLNAADFGRSRYEVGEEGRARRHGGDPASARPQPATAVGDEGAARRSRQRQHRGHGAGDRCAGSGALPRRSADHRPARPSRHPAGARARHRRQRTRVLHDAADPRPDVDRDLRLGPPTGGAMVAAACDRGAAARLRNCRLCPFAWRDPPRPEARQRDGRPLRRDLRDGLGAGTGARCFDDTTGRRSGARQRHLDLARRTRRRGARRTVAHARWPRRRYTGLHGASTGARRPRSDRPNRRRLLARCDVVRTAGTAGPVRAAGSESVGAHRAGSRHGRATDATACDRPLVATRAGHHLREGDGPGTQRTLRDRNRAGRGPSRVDRGTRGAGPCQRHLGPSCASGSPATVR